MQNIIDNATNKLSEILQSENVDWELFDSEVKKIEDINAFDDKYEETILSEVLKGIFYYQKGEMMPKIVEYFFKNGYDCTANNGLNGELALDALCWSSYDKYILDAAKVLLDAKAFGGYTADDDNKYTGLLDSLEWKLSGAWGPDSAYDFANILEAYYAIVKACEKGKNYNDIYSFHKCLGKTLTKVSYAGNPEELQQRKEVTEFAGSLIFWFGKYPLVVKNYMDMVVNPIYVCENNTTDISSSFDKIIGAKLKEVRYLDSITCYLEFDNGYRILFSNYSVGEKKRNGLFEIRKVEYIQINALEIKEIRRSSGKVYSSTVVEYDEEVLALVCEDGVYCLFPDERKGEKHSIRVIECSKGLLLDYYRKFPLDEITEISEFEENGALVGLRLKCAQGYLYIKTGDYYELEILLSLKKFNPNDMLSLFAERDGGIHMEFPQAE